MAKTKQIVFTPSAFFQYGTCPHWIWHDYFTDPKLKGELSEFAQRLLEQGVVHEEKYVQQLNFIKVDTKDIGEALRETLHLMENGEPLIYQGLIETEIDGIVYRGRPDLLEKREGKSLRQVQGKSKFGDWYYMPIDIKSSSELKSEQLNQLILYAIILEKVQGVFPDEVDIINRDQERIHHKVTEKDKEKTVAKIYDILKVAKGDRPPLTLTRKCKDESPWGKLCLEAAEAVNDIALIYNLHSKALVDLRNAGVKTVKDLAAVDIYNLPKISYASPETLKKKQLQAKALLNKEIIWTNQPEVPEAPVKIYFDIEGDPLLGVEYLFGFWVVGDKSFDSAQDKPYYKYFLAEQPEDEGKMWQEFLLWVKSLPQNYLVYHYHNYEKTKLKMLGERYSRIPELAEFEERLVDLERVVQDSVVMPLYFYSIKDIAKYLGFKWSSAKAGGAQSIFWYEEWLEKQDRRILEDIVQYNMDDVKATEVLHKWLSTPHDAPLIL